MIYTIYNPVNGQILNTIHGDNPDWMVLNLNGKNAIAGNYSAQDYYIDNGNVIVKPVDPSTGYKKYNFDYTTKSWVFDAEATISAIRKYRDEDLGIIDKINPIWYSSLTQEQQTELKQYRQALLDVPQQSGFPETVTWPTKPSWL